MSLLAACRSRDEHAREADRRTILDRLWQRTWLLATSKTATPEAPPMPQRSSAVPRNVRHAHWGRRTTQQKPAYFFAFFGVSALVVEPLGRPALWPGLFLLPRGRPRFLGESPAAGFSTVFFTAVALFLLPAGRPRFFFSGSSFAIAAVCAPH